MSRIRRGLTLVEVVVAAALMGISLFCLVSVLPTAKLCLKKGEDIEAANQYGQEVLEAARIALPTMTPLPAATSTSWPVNLNNQAFQVTQTITRMDQLPCSPTHSVSDIYYLYELDVVLARSDNVNAAGKVINPNAAIQLITRTSLREPVCP